MSSFARNTKIVLFGASMIQQTFDVDRGCWGAMLANHFQRVADVVSRGFNGYNTNHLKVILPQILDEFDSDEVSAFVILLGANDCNHDTHKYVELPKFNNNYREILSMLKNKGFDPSKLLLLTPTPYDHTKYSEYRVKSGRHIPKRNIEYVKSYVDEIERIAQSENLKLINLFEIMSAQENWSDLLFDGLHISVSGSKLIFESVLPEISDRILLHRGSLDKRFVHWRQIDHECPENTLKPR